MRQPALVLQTLSEDNLEKSLVEECGVGCGDCYQLACVH